MTRLLLPLSAGILLLLLASCGCNDCGSAATDQANGTTTADISLDDLKSAMADNRVTLIDANGSVSFARFHIPGAIDFQAYQEAGTLAEALPEDKDALIVAYCSGPRCGAYRRAVSAARELGYTNVVHYSGGTSGWQAAHAED